MKITIFALSLFVVISIADALEITEKDSEQQHMETQVMDKPITKRLRRATTKPPNDNKKCNCSPGAISYFRWGNSTCSIGADLIYSGVVAGSDSGQGGAAVNPLCLHPNPQYLLYQDGYQGHVKVYGAEYQIDSSSPLNNANDRNVPCALCTTYGRTTVITIPSRIECPSGWRREYHGYLMAGHHGKSAATQFTCVDKDLQQIPGSGANTNGYLFYTAETQCNQHIPCSDKELTCVVCTK